MEDSIIDHVQVNVSVQGSGAPRDGFGKVMIPSHTADFAERARTYSSLSGVAVKFPEGTPEWYAAKGVFAQKPRPKELTIGRVDDVSVFLKYAIAATADDDRLYAFTVYGVGFDEDTVEYTADGSALVEEIHAGLVTGFNAVVGKNFTAALAAVAVADFPFTANAGTDTLTKVAHNLLTGDGPVQTTNTGGALPAGLAALTNYYVIKTGPDTFKLATSLVNALAGTAVDITDAGTGTQTLDILTGTGRPSSPITITANDDGGWFGIEVVDQELVDLELVSIDLTHTVTGMDDALESIAKADGSWYAVLPLYPSTDYVKDVAAWVEENNRIMLADSPATAIVNTVFAGATDVARQLFDLSYTASLLSYHHSPKEMLSARLAGRWLSTDPGKAVTAYKTLVGATTSTLNANQRKNADDKRANYYKFVAQRGIFWSGKVPSTLNKWIDVTRNAHWTHDEVQKRVFGLLGDADVIPYTRGGTQSVVGAIKKSLDVAVRQGVADGEDPDNPPTVIPPDYEDIDEEDKGDRVLRNVQASFKMAGAIQTVIVDINVSF